MHAFSQPRWAVGLLGVALAGGLAVVAFGLLERRDLGAGMLPERSTRVGGGRDLTGAFGLALRLHRGTTIGWAVGLTLLGSMLGTLVANIDGFLSGPMAEMFLAMGGQQGLVEAFLATEWGLIGVFLSAYAVAGVLRLRGEETDGRADLLLVTPLTRWRWAASHLVVTLGGAAVLLLLGGLVAGVSTARALDDGAWFGQVLAAAAVQLPAVAVLAGLTMLAVGLVPRLASAVAWGALVAFLLLGEVGALLEWPAWLLDLSPFGHTPQLPGGDVQVGSLVGLVTVALVLGAAGLAAFRRRDLE